MRAPAFSAALAAVTLLTTLAAPAATDPEDGWAAHQRSGGYPGECTEAVRVPVSGGYYTEQQCFGAYRDVAQGETVFFQGTGFERGTVVTMRVRGLEGETLAQNTEELGVDNVPGELAQYWQPELDWRVPGDAPPGHHVAEIEWDGKRIAFTFLVHAAPRIFTPFGSPPARGEEAVLSGFGFEAGPLELTVVQGGHRWQGFYRVEGANESSTLSTVELSVPGAAAPAVALRAWMHYGALQAHFLTTAEDGADVSVWMNGTRGGAPTSATLAYRHEQGGPRAWVQAQRAVTPDGPTPTTRPPCLAPGGSADFAVRVFAIGQHGPTVARILREDGTVVAETAGEAAGYFEVGLDADNATIGSYVASVGDERVTFNLGNERGSACPPPPPLTRRAPLPLDAWLAPLGLAGACVALRRRMR